MDLYNQHTYIKITGVILIILSLIFLLVLFIYQGGATSRFLGSNLADLGATGAIIAEIIIILLLTLGLIFVVRYYTLTGISKKLTELNPPDLRGVQAINPGKNKNIPIQPAPVIPVKKTLTKEQIDLLMKQLSSKKADQTIIIKDTKNTNNVKDVKDVKDAKDIKDTKNTKEKIISKTTKVIPSKNETIIRTKTSIPEKDEIIIDTRKIIKNSTQKEKSNKRGTETKIVINNKHRNISSGTQTRSNFKNESESNSDNSETGLSDESESD